MFRQHQQEQYIKYMEKAGLKDTDEYKAALTSYLASLRSSIANIASPLPNQSTSAPGTGTGSSNNGRNKRSYSEVDTDDVSAVSTSTDATPH